MKYEIIKLMVKKMKPSSLWYDIDVVCFRVLIFVTQASKLQYFSFTFVFMTDVR